MRGPAPSKPCPPAVHFNHEKKGTQLMIVLGADMHKSSHTIAAIAAATGEVLDDNTVAVGARGFDQVLRWARDVAAGLQVWRDAHALPHRPRAGIAGGQRERDPAIPFWSATKFR